jgi:hypothetical protein
MISPDAVASDQAARVRSMLAHPAGKAGVQYRYPGLDDQPGVAELLAKITAPPLPQFDEEVYEVMAGLADLMISKQADYGPRAINDSPGGPLNGINVRLHDKLSRVVNLVDLAVPFHESIRDTYRDIANYAVIAVMVLDGTWPE